jgi:hypothetical protein
MFHFSRFDVFQGNGFSYRIVGLQANYLGLHDIFAELKSRLVLQKSLQSMEYEANAKAIGEYIYIISNILMLIVLSLDFEG